MISQQQQTCATGLTNHAKQVSMFK